MGLFDFGKSKSSKIESLIQENARKSKRIKELEQLSDTKDSFFMELMSDALRHGSSLAGKHMSDRKKYLKGK